MPDRVFLGDANCHDHTLIDRALYLPEGWTENRARCAEVPCSWETGDCVYGGDHRQRRLIETHGRGRVLAIRNNQGFGQAQVPDWVDRLTEQDWHRHSAGDGAKKAPASAIGLGPATRPKCHHRLVDLATAPSATRKEMSLENS